jgi:membrane protein
MKRILVDFKNLLIETFNKAIDEDIITQGAAIAFYTIFSIAPLFVLIIALGGIFYSEELISTQLYDSLEELLGADMAATLEQFLQARSETDSGFITTIIATGLMLFGATTVINQLKIVLNSIWNVKTVKIHSLWHLLINRLLAFGMIILFSLLLIFSMVAEGLITFVSNFFYQIIPNVPLDVYLLFSEISTMVFAVLFFTLIFKILPDVHARWKDVIIGAIVTTALFMLGKSLIGMYLTADTIQASYRAAGSFVIFLIWVYYNIQIILLGAVFTQVYTQMFGGRILPYRFVELKEIVGLKQKTD